MNSSSNVRATIGKTYLIAVAFWTSKSYGFASGGNIIKQVIHYTSSDGSSCKLGLYLIKATAERIVFWNEQGTMWNACVYIQLD